MFVNIEEIKKEIANLEAGDTNWNNIQKLSWLYSVYDHMGNEGTPIIAHEVHKTMPDFTGEFGEAVSGVDIAGLMNILSEHMAVVKVLYPKEYQAVLDKIKEIP